MATINGASDLQPVLSHAEPVLPVRDVSETLGYWQKVLGFPNKWIWGEPPNHGGASWHGVFVQFSLDPDFSPASAGASIWIRVKHVEALYQFHRDNQAVIVDPLENRPWGMAQYTLREINGHYLHFAGAPLTERDRRVGAQPAAVQIVARLPSPEEYARLMAAVGWATDMDAATARAHLATVVFAVVAEAPAGGEAVGCALVLGDGASFYYVKDVMVQPEWQSRGVGTALMQRLTQWLEEHGAENALVGLYTGEMLEPFYQRFGFRQAFGMIRRLERG